MLSIGQSGAQRQVRERRPQRRTASGSTRSFHLAFQVQTVAANPHALPRVHLIAPWQADYDPIAIDVVAGFHDLIKQRHVDAIALTELELGARVPVHENATGQRQFRETRICLLDSFDDLGATHRRGFDVARAQWQIQAGDRTFDLPQRQVQSSQPLVCRR